MTQGCPVVRRHPNTCYQFIYYYTRILTFNDAVDKRVQSLKKFRSTFSILMPPPLWEGVGGGGIRGPRISAHGYNVPSRTAAHETTPPTTEAPGRRAQSTRRPGAFWFFRGHHANLAWCPWFFFPWYFYSFCGVYTEPHRTLTALDRKRRGSARAHTPTPTHTHTRILAYQSARRRFTSL